MNADGNVADATTQLGDFGREVTLLPGALHPEIPPSPPLFTRPPRRQTDRELGDEEHESERRESRPETA